MTVTVQNGRQWAARESTPRLDDLNNQRMLKIAVLAIQNGADPSNGFLELTENSIKALRDKYPQLLVVKRTKGTPDSFLMISDQGLDYFDLGVNSKIGIEYSVELQPHLTMLQEQLFRGKFETMLEETTLANTSFSTPLTEEQKLANTDYYHNIRVCALNPEDYSKWIKHFNADLLINQHEIHDGALLRLTFRHLKELARKSPNRLLLMRDEHIPLDPSKRWQSLTAKTALYYEKELRKGLGATASDEYSQVYVFCAEPARALDISLEPLTLRDKTSQVIEKLRTYKWWQSTAIVVSLIATYLAAAMNKELTSYINRWANSATNQILEMGSDPENAPEARSSRRPDYKSDSR